MLIMAMKADWLGDLIYSIFGALDWLIYNFVGITTQGLFNIAGTRLFTGDVLESFTQRIYIVLGIFMLFKLSFSLLNSVVNPDLLTDKDKGMGKVVTRTVTALIMLVMVPTIFSKALDLQEKLLPVVPKLIIGKATETDSESGSKYGEIIAVTAWKAFVTPNPDCNANQGGTATNSLAQIGTLTGLLEEIQQRCNSTTEKTQFRYDFNWFISPFVGLFLAFVMLMYGIDIAIRAIKLGLLQLLAPIPIISYIDPKSSGKDGSFSSWLGQCVSTYIDLFIKMAMVYFVIFVIGEVINNADSFVSFSPTMGSDPIWAGYVTLFIIIGAFFFLRQAPKFISSMLGVKSPKGSIGLSGLLAGTAAAVGGAGFAGAAAAGLSAMDTSAEAAAQGKQAPGGWTTGRDLAAQMRTGNEKAKGGMMNSLQNRIWDARADRKYGWTDAKENKSKWEKAVGESGIALREANEKYTEAQNQYDAFNDKYQSYDVNMRNDINEVARAHANDPDDSYVRSYAASRYNVDYDAYKFDRDSYSKALDNLQATRSTKIEAENRHSYNQEGYNNAKDAFDKLAPQHHTPKPTDVYDPSKYGFHEYQATRSGNQGGAGGGNGTGGNP